MDLVRAVVLPVGLGLLGFVEPCSLGSTFLFIKYLEGTGRIGQLVQLSVFAAVRSVFFGALGVLAVVLGGAFIPVQRAAWIGLGALYVLIGVLYLTGGTRIIAVSLGPRITAIPGRWRSAGLGVLFGLNVPACATPLLLTLFGMATAGGIAGAALASGFVSLALFGLALSLPLVAAVIFAPTRRVLDWLATLSRRQPYWIGAVLIVLGAWSIWLAVVAAPITAGQFAEGPLAVGAQVIVISVPNIPGPYCAYGVEKRLLELEGVDEVQTSWEREQIRIVTKEKARLTADGIKQAIKRADYPYTYDIRIAD